MDDINKNPANPTEPAVNGGNTNEGNNEPQPTPNTVPSQPVTPPVVPKEKFTKRERLEHAKNKIEKELEELEDEDDSRPLTIGDYKKLKLDDSKQIAIELADSIQDPDEQAAVKDLLETRIIPSGKPEEDLKLARSMVNAAKNQQILEEESRKATPTQHSSAPGAPAPKPGEVFTPTEEERTFMAPPYNLSQDDIIKARQATAARQG